MTKRRIVRSILSVFLSLVLILSGFLPGMPFVSTLHAETATKTITPGTDDAKTGTGTMGISLTIKKTPGAGDFTFTPPTSLIYDGQAKAATVSAKAEGMGEVTVEYYNGDTKLSGAPTAEGTYTVKVNVAEGDGYKAATGITADSWTFTIAPMQKTMTITLAIHGHQFTYGAEGATITATCGSTVGNCDLTDKKVSLTLNAPKKKKDTDSLSASATLDAEELAAFNKATGLSVKESDIEYYKGETKLDAAPTEKGNYTAKLTVGTGDNKATATVNYSIETTTQTGSMEITLTIAPAEVKTAPTANELKYNGTEQALVTSGKAKVGTMQYQIGESATTAPTGTWSDTVPKGKNAGTYYVWYRAYVGEKNFTEAECVTASIAKRSVTLTSADATKAYDGTALTNTNVTVGGDGFVTGEGATYNVTGTQTLPGNSKNTFGYTLKTGTTAGNYEITKTEGTLTVTDRTDKEGDDKKYEITVTANSDEVTYDGTEKSVSGFVQTTFTFNGVTYTVSGLTATAKGTDAGSYTAKVTGTAVVKDSKNNDLTKQFIVSTSNGTLTINKRNVTLTSATASKTYDGNALTDNTVTTSGDGFAKGEGATYSVTGSQKVVGSSANAFTYTLNTGTKKANYNITKTEGTLTVTSRDAKYQISPQAKSGKLKYDGQSHEVTGFKTDTFTVEGNTYTVSGLTAAGSGTDAGSYTVSVSGTAVVKDSDGNDVSDQFSVIPQTGTLTINKRSVTLTSASDKKEYDGDALTNDEVTVTGDGFVTGEGATYDVTGTRTLVGSSKNDFTYTLNEGTKADNYDITPSFGTLTVTNRNTKYEVTLKANSGTEKYDGKEKTVSGYTIDGKAGEGTGESVVTSFTASNGKTYTVTGMSAEVTGTNAGEYVVNVIGTPIVKDADGNDVTAQFAISVESGKLTIGKRSVTLTSAKDTKVYDGKPLSNDKITVSEDGFAEGEGATYDVTGSQTLAGESANTFTYSLNEGTIADNYDITTVEGKLTVTKSDSSGEVTAVSGLVYDGKAKALVKAGKTEGGTLMYRLGTDGKWQQDIPEATNAGTYKIYYYIKGDDNHKDDGSEKEPKGSVETTIKKATINLKSVTQKNNKVQISWTKVNEADGYDVYVRYCGSKAKKPVKTIKKNTTTKTSVAKINGKKINHKKNFYVKVYAYKMVNGKKKIIAKTITAHLAGTKSVKYTNPKALKLTKSTYSIKVGKTSKIKAKVTLKNSKKKLLPKSHAAKLRYKSSNTKIATVNKNGTIKGKKKGTCYIYVYTVNGLMKKVKVTVK